MSTDRGETLFPLPLSCTKAFSSYSLRISRLTQHRNMYIHLQDHKISYPSEPQPEHITLKAYIWPILLFLVHYRNTIRHIIFYLIKSSIMLSTKYPFRIYADTTAVLKTKWRALNRPSTNTDGHEFSYTQHLLIHRMPKNTFSLKLDLFAFTVNRFRQKPSTSWHF